MIMTRCLTSQQNAFFYVESQVPFYIILHRIKRPMFLGTAPIFKINLLLADIPVWIAAASSHILKVWARSLKNSRHHLTMSCKKATSRCPRERFIGSALVPVSGSFNQSFNHPQSDVNRLTREIKFATLSHGKSPFFRLDFVANKIIAENSRLAFVFF